MSDFEDTWATLVQESANHRAGRIVRRVGPITGPGTFLAIDCATKRRWFLAELEAAREDLQGLPDWREIRPALVSSGSLHGSCFGLELESAEYLDVFSALTRDVISALDGVTAQAERLTAIRDRLQKWNRFLKEHGHRGLTEDRARGLFAELWVLQERIMDRLSLLDSIRAWKGPDADAHDFRRDPFAVEIKSAGLATPVFISISNEAQLDDAGLEALWLYVVSLDDAPDAGMTLPELVSSLRARVLGDPSARNAFDQKLQRSGYLDDAAPLYRRRYGVVEEAAFHVREGFPRLIRPPAGIHALKYRLLVDELQPFTVPPSLTLDTFCSEGK